MTTCVTAHASALKRAAACSGHPARVEAWLALNQMRRMLKTPPSCVVRSSILRWKSGLVSAWALPQSQCSGGGCGSSASALWLRTQQCSPFQCHAKSAAPVAASVKASACSMTSVPTTSARVDKRRKRSGR